MKSLSFTISDDGKKFICRGIPKHKENKIVFDVAYSQLLLLMTSSNDTKKLTKLKNTINNEKHIDKFEELSYPTSFLNVMKLASAGSTPLDVNVIEERISDDSELLLKS